MTLEHQLAPLRPFGTERYVPVILTRQGERLALRELPNDVKVKFTPLFAVHPVARDLESGGPAQSVDTHLRKLLRQLTMDWGAAPAFVDLVHFNVGARMDDGTHPLDWFVRSAASAGLSLTPVFSPDRHATYRAAAADVAADLATGLCFRLTPADWTDLGSAVGDGRLFAMLSESRSRPDQVHLVLDLEDGIGQPNMAAAAMRAALRALPQPHAWRSVTVVGTGMPSATSDLGADTTSELLRSEWSVWRLLRDDAGHRMPSFGDYCVQHPDPFSDFDPRFMQSAAQLRYTIAGHWLVVRGRGLRVKGTDQIRGLAAEVVRHQGYMRPEFSWGDRWLADCASGNVSPGNQMIWRKATTNHHLTFVVRQLASLLGS